MDFSAKIIKLSSEECISCSRVGGRESNECKDVGMNSQQQHGQEQGQEDRTLANSCEQKQGKVVAPAQYVDRRPAAIQMRKMQALADSFTQRRFPSLQKKTSAGRSGNSQNPRTVVGAALATGRNVGTPAQLAKTTLPAVGGEDLEFKELDLVLDSESVFDESLSDEAGQAYYDYLKGTPEKSLPSILGQVKAILAQLESGERKIPKSWEHVPIAQIAAIIGHSLQGYRVNADLRGSELNSSKHRMLMENYPQLGNTVLGLDRQLPYVGWVYRGQSVPSSAAAAYVDGATIVFKGFTSTTKSALVSEQFKPTSTTEIGMMLTMYSVTGRDISEIAHDPSEKEVLFSPGTEFRIVKVEQGVKMLEVTMVESGAGDLDAAPPDRLFEADQERPPVEEDDEHVEESSGPSMMDMLSALMTAKVDIPGDVNPVKLLELYNKHILGQ
jgi:hypothetical protein